MQLCLAHDYVVSYDNVRITAQKWEEIGIKWDNGYGKLLRPISYAEKHGLTAGECRYFNLTEFGVPHAKITITYTKPLLKWQVHQLLHDKQPVIGIYIHQTKDVRTYRFTDKHGHISTLNVTPNHPFYVKSLHAYLPISHITNTMSLDGVHHQSLYLLCLRHQHCGVIYEPNKFKTVYNLEVAQQHFFRVGLDEIKVHNSDFSAHSNLPETLHLEPLQNKEGAFNTVSSDPQDLNWVIKKPQSGDVIMSTDREFSVWEAEVTAFKSLYGEDSAELLTNAFGHIRGIRMRRVAGIPLKDILSETGRLPTGSQEMIGEMIGFLLHHNIKNADVNLGNIMYSAEERIMRPIDFGRGNEMFGTNNDIRANRRRYFNSYLIKVNDSKDILLQQRNE